MYSKYKTSPECQGSGGYQGAKSLDVSSEMRCLPYLLLSIATAETTISKPTKCSFAPTTPTTWTVRVGKPGLINMKHTVTEKITLSHGVNQGNKSLTLSNGTDESVQMYIRDVNMSYNIYRTYSSTGAVESSTCNSFAGESVNIDKLVFDSFDSELKLGSLTVYSAIVDNGDDDDSGHHSPAADPVRMAVDAKNGCLPVMTYCEAGDCDQELLIFSDVDTESEIPQSAWTIPHPCPDSNNANVGDGAQKARVVDSPIHAAMQRALRRFS